MRRTEYLVELRQDAGFAWRQLRRSPGFTTVALLTLALGIAGTTAIFSAVYAVVLKPLPLRDPARIVVVSETMLQMPGVASDVSAGNYIDANRAAITFDGGLAAVEFASFNLAVGPTPERVAGARVTANYFDVMGTAPALGRVFRPDEDRPGREHVVVLSHRLWARAFGASASAVGGSLRMNAVTYTIIGVMPAAFDLTTASEALWVPIAFTPERRAMHDEHYLTVFGRLKPGVSPQQASASLEVVSARLRQDFPKDDEGMRFTVTPYFDQFVGDYRTRLFVLLAAVALVLLIACGNVANLLLARGAARGREIAVRSALGAGRSRIVRQLMTESAVLALVAAGAGIVLAWWCLAVMVRLAPTDVPRLDHARVDPVALAFAVVVALASSVAFGLVPALRLTRTDVQGSLRDGGRTATVGGPADRMRMGLIASEVALSLLLLFGAGLLIRSAIALQHVNPGFDPRGVLSARVVLPAQSYPDPARLVVSFERIAEAAQSLPGVTSAAVTSFAAMGGGEGTNGLLPEGREPSLRNVIPSGLRIVSPDFFKTMRIPILSGRGFDERDRAGSQKVMIIGATLAAAAFPGQDPIGKRIACCEPGPGNTPGYKVVIGVAGDIHSSSPRTPPRSDFYLPLTQTPHDAWSWIGRSMYILARTDGDADSLAAPMGRAVARFDPDVPLFDVRVMDARLATTLATSRFNTLLLSILGGIGLLLAASGIYGVIAYLVSQRTREIGVRIALGAHGADVVRLVLGQALKPIAAGTLVGVGAALAASRVLTSQLYGVSGTDPTTMAAVVVTLVSVAVTAGAVPARRAAAIDPARTLQSE